MSDSNNVCSGRLAEAGREEGISVRGNSFGQGQEIQFRVWGGIHKEKSFEILILMTVLKCSVGS